MEQGVGPAFHGRWGFPSFALDCPSPTLKGKEGGWEEGELG